MDNRVKITLLITISTFLFSQNSRWAAEIFIYQGEEGTTEQLSFQATLASNVLVMVS